MCVTTSMLWKTLDWKHSKKKSNSWKLIHSFMDTNKHNTKTTVTSYLNTVYKIDIYKHRYMWTCNNNNKKNKCNTRLIWFFFVDRFRALKRNFAWRKKQLKRITINYKALRSRFRSSIKSKTFKTSPKYFCFTKPNLFF